MPIKAQTNYLRSERERRHSRRHRSAAGFTLLEILVAIALLAAVAALLITNLDKIFGSGNREIAKIFVNEALEPSLMTYKIHMGSFPSTEEGLEALIEAPSEDAERWSGPYIKELSTDPWGSEYQYRFPGEKNPDSYDLWSLGPDKEESDDDIGNWKSEKDEEG